MGGPPRKLAIALAGGGTGGHVRPGVHVLSALLGGSPAGRGQGPVELERVLWFGAGRGVEDLALAGLSERLDGVELVRRTLRLEPAEGGAPSMGRLVARALPEARRARRELGAARIDVLLGLGGYTELPAVLAARSLGIPVALLEINAVRGRATRALAPLAARVFHAWPSTLPARPGRRHVWTGPPLGPEFCEGDEGEARELRGGLGFDPGRPLLLVLGGSQGALSLNRFVRDHTAALVGAGLQVLHQVGPGRSGEAAAPGNRPGYRSVEYLQDVAGALRAATLVLSRGGASTLAEIAALGTPVLVVPYPHHPDRHQERNAALLGEGAVVVPERRLDAGLVGSLAELAGPTGAERRSRMTRALRAAVPRDASARIGAGLVEIAGLRGETLELTVPEA